MQQSAIALHVEAAKRLLHELEQHASVAIDALDTDAGAVFVAAVAASNETLLDLDAVVSTLTEQRSGVEATPLPEAEAAMLDDVSRAAAAALESHERLLHRTRQERDRIADVGTTAPGNPIASQYAAVSKLGRARTLSVTA